MSGSGGPPNDGPPSDNPADRPPGTPRPNDPNQQAGTPTDGTAQNTSGTPGETPTDATGPGSGGGTPGATQPGRPPSGGGTPGATPPGRPSSSEGTPGPTPPSRPSSGAGTPGSAPPSRQSSGGGAPGATPPDRPSSGGGAPGATPPNRASSGGGTPGATPPSRPSSGGGTPGATPPGRPSSGGGTPGATPPGRPSSGGGTPGATPPSRPPSGVVTPGATPPSRPPPAQPPRQAPAQSPGQPTRRAAPTPQPTLPGYYDEFPAAASGSQYLHEPFKTASEEYFAGLDFMEHGADFEAAISATGFGRFHFCLLAVTGLIYANTAIGITIVSFVLPAATCDFRMSSADKGWLTAAPMLGMVLGSYFWGCLADTKGRKVVLVSTLLMDGFVGILSSFVQILPIFMACRFINGFSVAGAMGICFPYLGEFQQTKYREKILCWMEMFWTLGVILLPLIAWGIIPISGIRIESGAFSYDSWNWFVAACGVPSLMLGFWLFYFPESPKFMMECGDYDDALKCLKSIYKQNTGDDPDNYPIKSLKEKVRTQSVGSQTSIKSIRSLSMRNRKDLKRLFNEIWAQTKALCKPPYLKYTILTCIIQFGLTTSYYTLMVWFPELFNRYEEFESRFPNTSASVCDVSGIVVTDEYEGDPFDCNKTIESSVFMHTLIVGLACIPTSLWLPLCVHKLGAKFFLIFSLGVAGVVTCGLYFVQNSHQNLVLSCIFEALTSLAISLVFCVLVDLFPTNLRVMAAALSLTAGRGGGLIGNLSFGYLIDINCVIPIVVFSAFLFLAAILCFFLPKTGQEALD